MSNTFHIALPPPQPSYNMKPGSRRAPLTPSTITPPSVSSHTPSATRHEGGSPTRAETLLAKVAQQPSNRRPSSPASPLSSTVGERQTVARAYSADQWHQLHQQHAQTKRSWSGQSRQDGYISFPDFEKYCGYDNGAYGQHQERSSVSG